MEEPMLNSLFEKDEQNGIEEDAATITRHAATFVVTLLLFDSICPMDVVLVIVDIFLFIFCHLI